MKIVSKLALVLSISIFSVAAKAAALAPKAITDQERSCKENKECAVVLLQCQCMYCARPDDLKNKVVDAVNSQHLKKYAELSKCSRAETARCATAGACANFGESIPVCKNEKCSIQFQTRKN